MNTHLIRFITIAAWVAALGLNPFSNSARAAPTEAPSLSGTVVVVNQASDTVTLVDLATMEAYKHVDVVGGPHEAAVSPDGKRVIVTNYNQRGGGGPQLILVHPG